MATVLSQRSVVSWSDGLSQASVTSRSVGLFLETSLGVVSWDGPVTMSRPDRDGVSSTAEESGQGHAVMHEQGAVNSDVEKSAVQTLRVLSDDPTWNIGALLGRGLSGPSNAAPGTMLVEDLSADGVSRIGSDEFGRLGSLGFDRLQSDASFRLHSNFQVDANFMAKFMADVGRAETLSNMPPTDELHSSEAELPRDEPNTVPPEGAFWFLQRDFSYNDAQRAHFIDHYSQVAVSLHELLAKMNSQCQPSERSHFVPCQPADRKVAVYCAKFDAGLLYLQYAPETNQWRLVRYAMRCECLEDYVGQTLTIVTGIHAGKLAHAVSMTPKKLSFRLLCEPMTHRLEFSASCFKETSRFAPQKQRAPKRKSSETNGNSGQAAAVQPRQSEWDSLALSRLDSLSRAASLQIDESLTGPWADDTLRAYSVGRQL